MANRALTPDQQEAVRLYVRRLLTERFGGNQLTAARRLGISQSAISDAYNKGTAGTRILTALAEAGETTIDAIIGLRAPRARAAEPPPATVAPDSPQPPSPVPISPTPMSPSVSGGTKRADNGRWRAFAALAPHFGAAATEALEAGASEKILDAASDRLHGQAPDYPTAVQAIVDAASGVATFRRIFGMEGDDIPGFIQPRSAQQSGPSKGKRSPSR